MKITISDAFALHFIHILLTVLLSIRSTAITYLNEYLDMYSFLYIIFWLEKEKYQF